MNDQVIIAVANAITAQAETLKALIDALPKETKAAVEKKVSKATVQGTPVASSEMPTVPVVTTPTPAVVETTTAMPAAPFPTQQVASLPVTPAPTAAMTPAPVVAQPVAAALPTPAAVAPAAAVSPSNLPFSDHAGMLKWTMDRYTKLGSELGKQIQDVLNSLGTKNINDVTPDKYVAFYNGVESIK
jgi:hypothetical protein